MILQWRILSIPGLAACLIAGSQAARGQDAAPDTLIVTGERLERTLAQTASSVEVITNEDLARLPDARELDTILDNTPNITLGSGGLGPTIRGQDTTGVLRDLPAFLGGNRPRTTLIVDGRPVSYNEFVFGTQPLWDISKVEIFRSPQTTTQGRNSIAGAIIVETEQPESTYGGAFKALAANDHTVQLSATLTGPIIRDQVAFRFSGDRYRSKSSSELGGGGQAVDPNEDRYDLGRAKLLFTPARFDGLELGVNYTHLQSQAVQIEGIREPYRERRDPFARYGVFRTDIDSLTFRPAWSIDDATSIRGIASMGWGEIRRFAPPGLGETQISSRDRTFEATLRHDRSRFGLVIGTAFSEVRQSQWIDISTVGLGSGTFADRQESFGIFGETTLRFWNGFWTTFGARYQSDRQRRSGFLATPLERRSLDYDGEFSWLLPKLSVAFAPIEAMTAGILIQKAANPGGTTLRADTGEQDTFAAETLWDFEVFLRGTVASAGLRYEANLFVYDISDGQRSISRTIETPNGPYFLVEMGNVPKSRSMGAEFQVGWSISERVDLSGSLGLLDTEITRTMESRDPLLGKEFQRSPHVTASLGAVWRATEHLSFDSGFYLRSGYFDDDLNVAARRIRGATVFNMRGSWKSGPITASVYARNVLDHFYLTSLAGNGLATAGDPREIGASIETRF